MAVRRALGLSAVIAGVALAAFAAEQSASAAAFQMWWDAVSPERATLFGLGVGAGVIIGSALLVAGGVETLRGARWGRWALAGALAVTVAGWAAVPFLYGALRPTLEADARDPMRFRHTLHFSGDLDGDLTDARFVLTIAGRERTCGPERGGFSLWQVSGRVGGEAVTLWISISPYAGPGAYRARHEYGPGVADPGAAELVIERAGARDWYARSGRITVDTDERSGSIDAVDGTPPWERYAPQGETRVTGTWRCVPGVPRGG